MSGGLTNSEKILHDKDNLRAYVKPIFWGVVDLYEQLILFTANLDKVIFAVLDA